MLRMAGLGVLVFVCEVLADFAWASYMLGVANNKAHRAGAWSGAIQLLGSITILAYVDLPWLVVPAIAGSYVGTVWAVSRGDV